MLGANLVCFQTYSYQRHFISSCIRVCGYETSANQKGIDVEGHVAAVNYSPVGIDSARVSRDIIRPGIQPKLDALHALYEGKKIIIGRDKLDVVKGVVQKVSPISPAVSCMTSFRPHVLSALSCEPSRNCYKIIHNGLERSSLSRSLLLP